MLNHEFQIRNCIESLGARNGIRGLALDADGGAGVKLKTGEEVYLRYMRALNTLYIYAIVAPLRRDADPAFVLSLLQKNCLGAGTEGGVLSVSEFLGAFVYQIALPADCVNAERLELEMERFLVNQKRVQRCFQ